MTTPPPQRRPGRPAQGDAPALSDDACLDVALAAFAERGFEGASIREIARAAGISHGLLAMRFGSKQALWIAAVDHGMMRLNRRMIATTRALPAAASVADRMLAACIDFLESLAEFPAIIQVVNIEGTQPGERLDYIVETFFRGQDWPFTTLLAEGQAQGVFRDVHVTVPFTLLAHGAGALVALRPLMAAVSPRTGKEPDGLARTIEGAASLIVRGLLR